jgi:microcystin-dependent protein
MADPFVAEIRIFPFNFAPKGWAFCNGQLMPLSQNTALFSLVGTTYGGDGKTTFGLPNLQGSAPMFWGQGPGLSLHDLGETGGSETITLTQSEMPSHTHNIRADAADPADVQAPSSAVVLARSSGGNAYGTSPSAMVQLANAMVASVGGDLPHNNMQPYLTLNFCIALQGVYPPRS